MLRARLQQEGMSAHGWAKKYGANTGNINMFMRGLEKPQRSLLAALGLKPKLVYVKR